MPPPDCPFCNHQNPSGAKFCSDCGSPLHLTPCGDCGAVNNLIDTHCWRCGGLLLPDPPVQRKDFERDPGGPERQRTGFEHRFAASERDPRELERELVALEQEIQGLEPAPGPAEARPPAVEHAPGGSSIPDPKAADPRPRKVEQAFRGANIPEPRSLFVAADDGPRGRRALIVTAFVVALGSAIAVGAYLLDRDRGSPETAASATPPSQIRAEPATAPRVAADVAEAPVAARDPAPPPSPKAVDPPIERRVASDAGEAPAVPAPAAAPEPLCPPAVEAMALCEWLVRANRQ